MLEQLSVGDAAQRFRTPLQVVIDSHSGVTGAMFCSRTAAAFGLVGVFCNVGPGGA
jgi:hypothetical protein